LNALGAAALILLIANPRVLFGASFQMTFLCVALVAGIGVPVLERTIQPYSHGLRNLNALAWDRALPPTVAQFRLDVRLLLSRIRVARHRLNSKVAGRNAACGHSLSHSKCRRNSIFRRGYSYLRNFCAQQNRICFIWNGTPDRRRFVDLANPAASGHSPEGVG